MSNSKVRCTVFKLDVDPGPSPTVHYIQKTHAFTQWRQHTRFLTDQLLTLCTLVYILYVCVPSVENASVCVSVCVKGMHSSCPDCAEQSRACWFLSRSIYISLSRSLRNQRTHTLIAELTWGIPGHFVIGLNYHRNNKRPFRLLVWLSFAALLINSHRKSLKAKICPDRSTAAEKVPKTRK